MKRTLETPRLAKKQKGIDMFSQRLRLVQFETRPRSSEKGYYEFEEEAFLENNRRDVLNRVLDHVVGASPELTELHREVILGNTNRLYLLIYDLGRDRGPVDQRFRNRGADEPLLKLVPTKVLDGLRFDYCVIVAWAIVEPDRYDDVNKLILLDTFVRGLNFGHHFYNLLFNEFDENLIVYRPFKTSIEWWRKIGALADTRELWKPRSPKSIGLGVPDELLFYKALTGAKLIELELALQQTVVQARNRLLLQLGLTHGCDSPILEAVSAHWPGRCRLRIDTRHDYKWRIVILSKAQEQEWCSSIDNYTGTLPITYAPDQVVRGARTRQRISSFDCPEWEKVFAKFDIKVRGSSVGHFRGLADLPWGFQ